MFVSDQRQITDVPVESGRKLRRTNRKKKQEAKENLHGENETDPNWLTEQRKREVEIIQG